MIERKGRNNRMSKLLDMFSQARRGQSGSGMGFLGKSKAELKPRAAAIVVEFTQTDASSAEGTAKAGADGLLFDWDSAQTNLETIKAAVDAAKTSNEKIVCGLRLSGDLDTLTREHLEQFKEQGINYVILPLQAPARLLALHIKEFDSALTIPMRESDLETYLLLIRNLSAFDTIAAVSLDFGLGNSVAQLTIEDVLHYRAVREAVRFPAMVNVAGNINEADAYTLTALGIQAIVLPAGKSDTQTKKAIESVRELLEKVYRVEKENTQPGKQG